ncbi:hypothetical protein CALVIDRAFT_533341 [Calocera viscosa TUFC12733]|uniref:Uncharacterized protein n=1 Tax=Calocera viscosa (strain TUFC12733) TaxID=1330018 RepID=A0A167QWX4_CALVF|nr:hypothetical protein CALVIDRAFT_533341 [Calocera viscosa TUFC12733]
MHRAIAQAARRPLGLASLKSYIPSAGVQATRLDAKDTTDNQPSAQNPRLLHTSSGAPEGAAGQDPSLPSFHHYDHYAKDDHVYDPVPDGTTHYVVSEPEHRNTPYEVPSGAFPTSSPYDMYASTKKPQTTEQPSSTSSTTAHPNTTQRVPTVNDTYPYGSSSSIRHTEAPGQMAKGSDKGVHLSEGVKVTPGAKGELASRNAWPSEEQGKAGLNEAWKARK